MKGRERNEWDECTAATAVCGAELRGPTLPISLLSENASLIPHAMFG
jgi:hypothetical protein